MNTLVKILTIIKNILAYLYKGIAAPIRTKITPSVTNARITALLESLGYFSTQCLRIFTITIIIARKIAEDAKPAHTKKLALS
mmetsp:Transcript_28370/g.25089  ORF Transcript_28370/g.25089 Transcript_28370/m.25089 type:complete len:83 (+) Transcript_28370:1082-1330(+)